MTTSSVVSSEQLLKGAWYALEQCGILLRDASILYREHSYSSAVALAMIGREEMGKCKILLDEWNEAKRTGKCPTVTAIRNSCEDHVEKQRKAQHNVTFATEGASALAEAVRSYIRHHPQSTEHRRAKAIIDGVTKAIGKRDPENRHKARSRGLYVDLDDSGSKWPRPSQMSQAEAQKLLQDAANDYATMLRAFDVDHQRGLGKVELVSMIETWSERPELPTPVWPE